MGSSGNLVLALFMLTLLWEGSMGQSGCTNVLIGMSSCLSYVTGSSKTPSSSCCSSLAGVVKSQPECLCGALDGSALSALGISINKTIALALPNACNVKTPPVSRCDGNRAPVMAPVMAPVFAPVESPRKSEDDSSVDGPSPASQFIAGSKQVLQNGETSDAVGDRKMQYVLLASILIVLTLLR
ncbi:non-specific lipid transfer protein GPI-anchored 5-like isoform X2 [Rutidosis leptorrhynchoides]|uniref:non-specific lipid transfer protein GPI-anchored 5-like isoform X2 n=1 Tax=Rutidosis leptorrhynchoides TaxID=125765 RepID=UPI003A99FD4F